MIRPTYPYAWLTYVLALALLIGCLEPPGPNTDSEGRDVLVDLQSLDATPPLRFRDTVYVSIYSDIYSESKDVKFNLTATLSIRNTSLTDSLYIDDIDYYNSAGELVREYLSGPIYLNPMQSIEYVIEEDDTAGGTGANFLVRWGSTTEDIHPIFEGIMISTHGQQGISFRTEGRSIRRR